MRHARIILTLLDDVVLSRRNATTGTHETLDIIPGSALHGCAAARLYDELQKERLAWTVFHSGKVRFGDALPLDDMGERAAPAPLSWHSNKADSEGVPVHKARWCGERIFNLAAEPDPMAAGLVKPPFQPRALREGHVSASGQHLKALRQSRMMTAIDDDGRVAQGQLFGYQSLREGQRFGAWLRFDDEVDDKTAQRVVDALCGGILRVGRSKAAHYGRVRAESSGLEPWAPPAGSGLAASKLTLWLQSDAALRDAWGQPTLMPDATSLGLPGARLDVERSFLRARQYSPWNGHRAKPELERQVLVAGSVITLERDTPFEPAELDRLAWQGVGTQRALGLGEVAVNHPLLASFHPEPELMEAGPAEPGAVGAALSAAVPLDAAQQSWLKAVQARAGTTRHTADADEWARTQLDALCRRWLAIRSYQGWAPDRAHGPGATQWGGVARALDRAATWSEVQATVLAGDAAAVPENDDDWDRREHRAPMAAVAGTGMHSPSLRDWLRGAVQNAQGQWSLDPAAGIDALKRLCQEARRHNLWSSEQVLRKELQRLQPAVQKAGAQA